MISIRLILLALNFAFFGVFAGERWFGTPNLGVNSGIPADISLLSDNTDRWKEPRKAMSVFFLRLATYKHYYKEHNAEFNALLKHLKKDSVSVVIDDNYATWNTSLRNTSKDDFALTKELVNKIVKAGVCVKGLAMQSILSKPHPKDSGYSMSQRFRDVERYFEEVAAEPGFESINIGIIDATPLKLPGEQYQEIYDNLESFLSPKYEIDFLLLDAPMDFSLGASVGPPKYTFSDMKKTQDFIKAKGWGFGLYVVDTRGKKSANSFVEGSMQGLQQALDLGIAADFYISTSWYQYPNKIFEDSLKQNSDTMLSHFIRMDRLLSHNDQLNSRLVSSKQ